MEKKIKLLVATHREYVMPENRELYVPVHVGSSNSTEILMDYQRDNEGDNISELNANYSELTALYWAWKNLECDYLGLVHYRRYFSFHKGKFLRQKKIENLDINRLVLSQDECEKLLAQYDVIVPKKRKYYIETLYTHYANTLEGSHLDKTKEIIEKLYPQDVEIVNQVMSQRSGYMFNMFIMTKEHSDAYCEWLFPILNQLYHQVDRSKYSSFEARYIGRVSELLFNVWLAKQDVSVKEVPFIYFGEVKYIKKIFSFLGAKFLKKKYKESF